MRQSGNSILITGGDHRHRPALLKTDSGSL